VVGGLSINQDDVLQRRFDLEAALDEPGLGTLVHPIYGSVQVKSTTYSVSSNQNNIGEFRLSINFETSTAAVSFIAPVVSKFRMVKAAVDARDAVDNILESNYNTPETPNELTGIADKVDAVYEDVFDTINSTVGLVQAKVDTFTTIVNTARLNVFTIVQQGGELKESFKAVYKAALDVVNAPEDLSDAWESLLDFGFTDLEGKTNTVPRENEENNKQNVNDHTRITALINAYEANAFQTFDTDTQLIAQRKLLNDSFVLLMEDFDSPSLAEDPTVRTTMASLRASANQLFADQLQNIWRVVTISPRSSSLSLISYQYYGNLDNLSTLQDLNPGTNQAFINKDIQAIAK